VFAVVASRGQLNAFKCDGTFEGYFNSGLFNAVLLGCAVAVIRAAIRAARRQLVIIEVVVDVTSIVTVIGIAGVICESVS
jgi:hypothetical protein